MFVCVSVFVFVSVSVCGGGGGNVCVRGCVCGGVLSFRRKQQMTDR